MTTKKKPRAAAKSGSKAQAFTAEERAAMKERARELKAEARASKDKEAGERDVLGAIDKLPEPDRAMARRLHALVKARAPGLAPKTWYGMPAYAKEGKVVCFFQAANKFSTRYSSFCFSDSANLDDGGMWPVAFALKDLTAAHEAKIGALVEKAVR